MPQAAPKTLEGVSVGLQLFFACLLARLLACLLGFKVCSIVLLA